MENQTPTLPASGRSPRWRLAGLTLLVLAMHAGALAWWLNKADTPPDIVAAEPGNLPAPGSAVAGLRIHTTEAGPPATTAAQAEAPPPAAASQPSTAREGTAPGTASATAKGPRAVISQKITQKQPPALYIEGHSASVFESHATERLAPTATANVLVAVAESLPPPPTEPGNEQPTAPRSASASLAEDPGQAADAPASTEQPAPMLAPTAAPTPAVILASTAASAKPKRSSAAPAVEKATVAKRVAVPPSMTLEFRVRASRKGLTLPADSTLTWAVQGNGYSASMVFEAMLGRSRSQTSVGSIDPVLGLLPRRFGDKNRTEVATHFDRSRNPPAIRFSNNAPDVPLQASTQDRLSVLMQLAAMVAGEPQRYPPGQAVVLHTVSSRDADLWRFVVKNTEVLDLPVGLMDTLHLAREALNPYDNRVEVWLAPSLGHMPVRILWTQANGDVVDQQLSDHQP